MNHSLILIECSDRVGLVTTITQILADHQMNIVAMREFVDQNQATFFTRIETQSVQQDIQQLHSQLKDKLPADAVIRINPKKEKKVAILVTKEYHCLGDTLTRHFFHSLGAEVCCVIGNYENLRPFTEKFSIPFHFVSHEGKNVGEFEEEIVATIEQYNPDFLVLAKFMRILSAAFVARYPGRIINIHHSFLPAFIGAHPYRQAYERGVKVIGATAHFVTNELDQGPIIVQQTIPVNHTFSLQDMIKAGKEIEKAVLTRAMSLVFEDRVFITGNRTIVFEN